MKRLTSLTAYIIIALSTISCAKQPKIGPNDATKRYLDAWMSINDIKAEPSGLGIYVLDDVPGSGAEIEEDGFVFMNYKATDLEGKIHAYTEAVVAQQLGTYDDMSYTKFYGPEIFTTYEGNIYAGMNDMLIGMKVGGKRKAIIPGWLLTYKDHGDADGYFEQSTTNSTLIYDVTVKDFTKDIDTWEIDSIGRFFNNDKILIDGLPASKLFINRHGETMSKADSLKKGFYYSQIKAPVSTEKFQADTTIYINYTGRLLNGQVFDTTIENVAKDNRIYSASKTYEPVQINWLSQDEIDDSDYTAITMGTDESSMIDGFAYILWQMQAMEKGIGVFYSPLGYAQNGSGSTIPAYSPLIFEIEIVAKPEE